MNKNPDCITVKLSIRNGRGATREKKTHSIILNAAGSYLVPVRSTEAARRKKGAGEKENMEKEKIPTFTEKCGQKKCIMENYSAHRCVLSDAAYVRVNCNFLFFLS